MKTLLLIIPLVIVSITLTAQKHYSHSFTQIDKARFDSCISSSPIKINNRIKKISGKLTIAVFGKSAMVFEDDMSDQNFHEYEYVGEIINSQLSLLKRINYNTEEFYLINCSTGTIDTLIGQPVFTLNGKYFCCINNPETDQKQYIQTGQIKQGKVLKEYLFEAPKDINLTEVKCSTKNSVMTTNGQGKFWIINFSLDNNGT